MQITFISTGKTTEQLIATQGAMYTKRISKYIKFNWKETPDVKSLPPAEARIKEGEQIIKLLEKGDYVILLDETGKEFTSKEFAGYINKKQVANVKHMVFILGGAYGFSDELYQLANEKMSLSKMTFPHQMVRYIFLEQLYRAFTIINNEPYHH
jgi:23S rRNA (pseudouridine1915-N3)-methyltransferase